MAGYKYRDASPMFHVKASLPQKVPRCAQTVSDDTRDLTCDRPWTTLRETDDAAIDAHLESLGLDLDDGELDKWSRPGTEACSRPTARA